MKILLAASEAVPFCKTGGLADVVGALAQLLAKRGHEVALFLPKYRVVEAGGHGLQPMPGGFTIPVGESLERASLAWADWGGATAYFVDHPKYFGRDGLYGEGGRDYPDNDERFIFFCRSVLEGAKFVDFRPDVIHCHDWQSALIPAYLRLLYHIDAFYAKTGTLLTIHNLAYQGVFSKDTLFLAGFGWSHFTADSLEYYGSVNLLKAGLVFADRLNTVSPTYAREIQSTAEFGRGLEGVLRQRSGQLAGILNGIDQEVWNPKTDRFLPRRYGPEDFAPGKAECKAAVRKEFGFPDRGRAPLAAIVSRLDPQKGLDLVLEVIPRLVEAGAQLLVVGDGSPELQADLARAASRYPAAVRLKTGFDEALAHRVYGAADLFLMPSRFEPCGLGQMIAMRYGAVPIVTRTGGLADTVREGADGNGFVAPRPAAEDLREALERALAQHSKPEVWSARVRAGMKSDFSWDRSAQAYEELYRAVATGPKA